MHTFAQFNKRVFLASEYQRRTYHVNFLMGLSSLENEILFVEAAGKLPLQLSLVQKRGIRIVEQTHCTKSRPRNCQLVCHLSDDTSCDSNDLYLRKRYIATSRYTSERSSKVSKSLIFQTGDEINRNDEADRGVVPRCFYQIYVH